MKRDTCRSCRAQIIWAETEKGRRMPLDAQPVMGGNIFLQRRPHQEPLAIYKTAEERAQMQSSEFFVSHFVTCLQSQKWRKK